jgi:hypothetical protein
MKGIEVSKRTRRAVEMGLGRGRCRLGFKLRARVAIGQSPAPYNTRSQGWKAGQRCFSSFSSFCSASLPRAIYSRNELAIEGMAPNLPSPKSCLEMVVYDPAAAQRAAKRERQEEAPEAFSASPSSPAAKRARKEEEEEASASSSGSCAGAIIVPHDAMARPVVYEVQPINAVTPRTPPPAARELPPCVRKHFLRALGLCPDLPVHFLSEKLVTNTDMDTQQNRFRIPHGGVERLRAILTPAELDAANLLHDMAPRPRHKPKQQQPADAAEAGEKVKEPKKKGKVHGGLSVKLVDLAAGAKQLELSRWDSSGATILKGGGYLDFIRRCSFREHDVVDIWVFIQRTVRIFGMEIPRGDVVLHVLVVKKQPPQQCCYCPPVPQSQ